MELSYAIVPEEVPTKVRHSQVLFPNGAVNLPRLEKEIRASSGVLSAIAATWVEGNNCVIAFKGALDHDEISLVDEIVSKHSGLPLQGAPAPVTSDNRPLVAFTKPDSSKKTVVSHDWTDPTTWYEMSVRVVNEVASDDGAQTIYSLEHNNVIDLYHGKVTQEDFVLDATGASYRVAVKINNVPKTEQDPHFAVGGDFTVNYTTGKITFLSALLTNDEVKVTYHYATTSTFTVRPEAGKDLKIDFAEVQFSSDVDMRDSVVFQPYGLVEVFAPQLLVSNGGPLPLGTKIPLGNPVVYKTMSDFQNEAVKSYSVYPALGGSSWRGSQQAIVVLDWDYVSSTTLKSLYGMEIRLSLQHHAPFGGEFATATFYCVSEAS